MDGSASREHELHTGSGLIVGPVPHDQPAGEPDAVVLGVHDEAVVVELLYMHGSGNLYRLVFSIWVSIEAAEFGYCTAVPMELLADEGTGGVEDEVHGMTNECWWCEPETCWLGGDVEKYSLVSVEEISARPLAAAKEIRILKIIMESLRYKRRTRPDCTRESR